ncbi:MAG: TolC family protein [Spirochaetaceae bacterium]|jgi:outer membrane protein TolC|nr:TolC family protein [Spirochaetaceae bacterium]
MKKIVLPLLLLVSVRIFGQTTPDGNGPLDGGLRNREQLLSAALRGNSGYLLAASRGREAQAQLAAAKAVRLPVVRFSSNLSYLTNPPSLTIKTGSLYPGGNIPIPIPNASATPQFPFPALPGQDVTFNLTRNTNYEFGLTLEQPIFTWGRIHNSIKAAGLGHQASALQLEQEKRNIKTALDSHLFTLAFLTEIRGLLAEQRRSAERLIAISEESYANGFLLKADLLSARLLSAEVRMGDYGITETWDNSFLAIKTITNLPDLTPSHLLLPSIPAPEAYGEGLSGESSGFSLGGREELLAQLSAGNMNIKLLSLQTQVRERTVAAAKGQFYGKPELGLFLQLTYSGPSFPFIQSGWKDDNKLNFTTTLGIRSLIFDGGGLYQSIRQKEEALTQARLEEEKGRRDLEEYLEKTLRQLEVSRYRQEYLALKIEAAQAQKDQAETAWKSGYGEERVYLSQELSWYRDRIALLQEELTALLIALQLENVLGR